MTVLQAEFTAGLLDPARPAPQGLSDGQGRPAGRRYDVYRNNVTASLAEALETGFPVVRKLVGDEFFRGMAVLHARAHPPRSPLMMHYGADFPAFLAGFGPARGLPYLPDVARLELALRRAYHAADAAPVDAAALAAIPPEALAETRMRFAPAVALIASDYPVWGIWQANARDGAKPLPRAEAALVARPGLDPTVSHVAPEAAPVLAALIEGAPLGTALDAARGEIDLPGLLGLLLSQGAVTAFH